MALFDSSGSKITAENIESWKDFKDIIKKLGTDKQKCSEIFDSLIRSIKSSEKSSLQWANFASLVGEKGKADQNQYYELWSIFNEKFGDGELVRKVFGLFGMWRFSKDENDWFTDKQDVGNYSKRSYWRKT